MRGAYRPLVERLEDRIALAPIAVAAAGEDVDRGGLVTLDGRNSRSGSYAGPDGTPRQGQIYDWEWQQLSGPDVTGGTGTLSGPWLQFAAPSRVTTLEFDLVVFDETG